MFLQEIVPRESVALDRIRIGCESSPEMLPGDEKDWNERNNGQGQHGAQREHSCECEANCQERPQDRRNEVRSEIGDLFNGLFEGIDDRTHRRVFVVVGRECVQMPQQTHSQREAHSLRRSQHQIASKTCERRFAQRAQKDENHRQQQQSHLPPRDDLIDEPLEHEWSEKREHAAGRNTQKTGQVPTEEWANLFEEPAKFIRYPRRTTAFAHWREWTTAPDRKSTRL